MPHLFVRQQGKVFGPLDQKRLQSLINIRKFEPTAEFGESWQGPWAPLGELDSWLRERAARVPTSASPAAGGSSAPAAVTTGLASSDHDSQSDSLTSLSAVPPKTALHRGFRQSLASIIRKSRGWLIIAATAAVAVAILLYAMSGSSSNENKVEEEEYATPLVTRHESSKPPRGPQPTPYTSRESQPPTPRDTVEPANGSTAPSIAPLTSEASLAPRESPKEIDAALGETDFTPEADPRQHGDLRYANVPHDGVTAVTALRTVRASIDLGISYDQYREKLQEHLPPVRLFLESPEASGFPELRELLSNASGCYAEVGRIWNESIYSTSAVDKMAATQLLFAARPAMWDLANKNIDAAFDLVAGNTDSRQNTLEGLAERRQTLAMGPLLAELRQQIHAGKKLNPATPVAAGNSPKRDDSPRAVPPGQARANRPFDRSAIEIAQARQLAESLQGSPLEPDDAETIKAFLALTKPREWALRNGDRSRGDVITIWADSVRLTTKKGDGRFPREALSPQSSKVIERISTLAETVYAIRDRLLAAPATE
jgi:hypothetical protein